LSDGQDSDPVIDYGAAGFILGRRGRKFWDYTDSCGNKMEYWAVGTDFFLIYTDDKGSVVAGKCDQNTGDNDTQIFISVCGDKVHIAGSHCRSKNLTAVPPLWRDFYFDACLRARQEQTSTGPLFPGAKDYNKDDDQRDPPKTFGPPMPPATDELP
jgi:hypothetical protein